MLMTILTMWMSWHHLYRTVHGAQECRQLYYSQPVQNKALKNHVIMNMNIPRKDVCNIHCFLEPNCLSFNVGPLQSNQQFVCEISDSDDVRHPGDLVERIGFTYRGTKSPCSTGGCVENSTCQAGYTSKGYRCVCPTGFTGLNCNQAVNDCSDTHQTTGIHHILNHGLDPFPTYCDHTNDGGGWTMVFKVVGGVSPPEVGQLWQSSSAHSENNTDALDMTTMYPSHYKNRIVMNWQTFNPKEVRVVLYENGSELISLKFNAIGTNNMNWFSQANLISSPWSDLKTATSIQFAIIGPTSERYFEASGPYRGCAADTGWLIVTNHPVCPWDNRAPKPSIQYSKQGTISSNEDYGNFGIADVLAVFVR